MNVSVQLAVEKDADELFADLREEDQRGIELVGVDGLVQLKKEIVASNFAYTGRVDDAVAAIWGIHSPSLLSGSAYVWMITSKTADQYPFVFARHSRRVIEKQLERTPLLSGVCMAHNKRSLRWLRWLGAEIRNLTHLDGVAVYPFQIRRA